MTTYRRLAVVGALAASTAILILPAPVAQATDDLILSVSTPGEQLLTDPVVVPVTMTATNPSNGGANGYNGSFTAILPPGIDYLDGSSTPAPALTSTLPGGSTALFFENVGDIQEGSSLSLSFGVTGAAAAFPVGSTIQIDGNFAANTDPRTVPDFSPTTGGFSGDTTGATPSGSSDTLLVPLTIDKANLTAPGAEMVRGVHDHVATYQLLVTNNGVANDTSVVVDDFVPAIVEFLGCGGVDNTTDAPTNPQPVGDPPSTLEYPGADPLTDTAAPAGPCPAPVLVESVSVTGGVISSGTATNGTTAPASVVDGVYTHVRWNVGTLTTANFATPYEINYQVGIPLTANEHDPNLNTVTGTDPTANLDNNTGFFTTENDGSELSQDNVATVRGTYTGPVAPGFDPVNDTTDDDTESVAVEDLAIQKDVSAPDPVDQGSIAIYSLRVRTSEYRNITAAVITDTLTDGQCPLLTGGGDPEATPQSGECAVSGNNPSFTLVPGPDVVENADGSYTITIDSTNDGRLADIAPSSDFTLTFSALVRQSYQEDFLDDAPFNGADRAGNDVSITGTTNLVSGIPDDPAIDAPTPIQDTGTAGFGAGVPDIDKAISLPAPAGSELDCLTATYVRTNAALVDPAAPEPYAYRIGDRVCFRLGVTFDPNLNYRNARVDDFLPHGTEFEQAWVTAGATSEDADDAGTADPSDNAKTGATLANEVVIDSIEVTSDPGGDLVTYRLGETDPDTVGGPYASDLFVDSTGVRFEVIISAVVTVDPAARTTADIIANLMKFTSSNLTNDSISLRDQADFQIVQPNLSVTKDVDPTVSGEGIPVDYTLEITNDFSDSGNGATYNPEYATALDVSAWDLLPPGFECADISALALGVPGSIGCTADLVTGRDGLEITVDRLEPQATATVTYTFTPPVGTPAGASFTNDFGIRSYQGTPTNDGDAGNDPLFVPSSNVDPSIDSGDYNMPPAEAQATITTPNPVVVKEQQSSLTDPGNISNGSLSIDPDEATIGETVQYRTSTSVAESVTVYNASFADTLPAGMSIVSIDSVLLIDDGAPGVDLTAPASGFTFTDDATSWLLTFPSQYDNLAGTGTDEFVVTYTAIVDGAAVSAGDDLDNTSELSFDDAPIDGTTATVDSNETTVTVVEPAPEVDKGNNATDPATPGAEIVYTLTVTNPVPASAAYDVEIVDTVPVGIAPLDASAGSVLTADGTVTGPSGSVGQWDASARTITWTPTAPNTALAQVDPAGSVTLDYAALLTVPAVADLPLTNNVSLSATSTPGPNASERTTYSDTSASTVTPPPATIDKSVPSAQTVYAIGEVVDFELIVTLPAGTVGFDTTVFDQLPDELTFDSFGTVSFSGPECQVFDPVTGTATGAYTDGAVTKYGAGVGGDAQRIAWFFNEIAADPVAAVTDCVITLPYSTHVDTDGVDGDTFNNSADLVWNAADDIPGPAPATLPTDYDDPDDPGWGHAAGPAEVTLDVDEPQLEVDIDTLTPASGLAGFTNDQTPGNDTAASDDADGTPTDGGDVAPGESLTQRVTVTNSGSADAFDTTVVVTVGVGVTPVDSTSGLPLAADGQFDGPNGEVGVWDATARTITFLPAANPGLAGPIAPAGTATLEYETVLDASDSLADQQDITDSADIPTYFGVPIAEQGQPDVPTYGNDPGATRGPVDTDATTVEVHFPELGVVKSAISDATDARFDTPFTFEFVITNTDAVATAFDVDATDTLPAGWAYVASSAVVTSPNNGGVVIEPVGGPGGPLVWTDLDDLEAGQTITIRYDATPLSSVLAPDKATGITNTGSFAHTNTVDVAGDDATGSPTFDGGTTIADDDTLDVFIRRVDLEVTKAIVSPPPPTPVYFGGFVEYEITVTNTGPDDATGVALTDSNLADTGLPTDTILFVGVVSTDRGTFDGSTGVWTVGDVAAGETLSLVVRTQMNTVDPPAAAVNEVEVSAADQFDADSDPGNLVTGSPVEDDEAAASVSPLPTTLGNFIWLDLNGDGIQDPTEPGIPSVPVVLTWTEPGGTARQFTIATDAAGAYNVPPTFEDQLNPGVFTSLPSNVPITVAVGAAANLAGLTPTVGPESDIDGGAPEVSVVEINGTTGVLLPDGVTLARIDVDFGYQPDPQALGDRVWWDQDASGDATDGAGEYGIGGVTLDITWYGFDDTLGTADDLTIETVTSDGTIDVDGDGNPDPAGTWSSFYDPVAGTAVRNIPPGVYDVAVDASTLPSGMTVDTYDLDGGNPTGSSTATAVVLALGDQRTDVDFSVAGIGRIGDTVYYDADGDGAQVAGEPGISGVTVQLTWAGPDGTFGTDDDAVLTTTTSDGTTDVDGDGNDDPAGSYLFSNLPDGTFEVVVDPAGTTLPGDVTQTADPDTALDGTAVTTLDAGAGTTEDLDVDFGYQGDLTVGDLVFYDVDANGSGVIDGPDVPLAGVELTVTWAGNDGTFGTDDDFSTTVTTSDGTDDVNGDSVVDPPGVYLVDHLPAGEVRVEVTAATLPSGVTAPTFDSDEPGAPTTITTPGVSETTLAGADDLDQDVSYTGAGSAGDTVWWDKDGDGVQSADEPGMPGVPVTLTSPGFDGVPGTFDDLTISTITSDGSTDVDGDGIDDPAGSYWFPNLPFDVPLTISVDDTALPPTFPPTHDADDTADESIVLGTPHEATFTLAAAAPENRDIDFGYAGIGEVGDRVWLDLNGDGLQDPGEPGLAGVGIDVRFAGPDGVFDTADDVVETTITSDGTTDVDGDGADDPAGSYFVDSLPLDEPIRVSVDAAALPAELLPTGDADEPGAATPNSSLVTLTTGAPTDLDQDFGYAGPAAIGDTVWYDVDADGAPEPAGTGVWTAPDVALAGIPVTVTGAGLDGALGTPDDYVVDLVTDADGEYLASGLFYGPHTVVVDTSALPAGVSTQTYDPDATLDAASAVTLDATTPQALDQDFSFTGGGAVGDTVWFDQNGDGIVDPGEPGLVGIPVTLASPGADGIAGTDDDLLITTLTSDGTTDVDGDTVVDPAGSYWFPNLPLDQALTITVDDSALPAGFEPVYDVDGIATPNTSEVTLTDVAPVADDHDFGYRGAGTIGDTVFFDHDGIDSGGVPDTVAGDVGLAGVDVTLTWTNPTGGPPLVITTTTSDGTTDVDGDSVIDPAGTYRFAGLPDGDYTIAIDPATVPAGMAPVYDPEGNADLATSTTLDSTTLPADLDRDFSFAGTGAIGDLIWMDSNADGVVDAAAGELGVARVDLTVEYTDPVSGASFVLMTTTGVGGAYFVDNLPAGDYVVSYDPATLPTGFGGVSEPDDVIDATFAFVLGDAEVRNDVDFGVRPMATVEGVVFNDLDGDGVQDPGEAGIPGVTVDITDANGDILSVVTAADGSYVAVDVLAGDLTIDVDDTTLPPDISLSTGNDPQPITAPAGETTTADPIGYAPLTFVTGTIWYDVDAAGDLGGDEPLLGGVTVELRDGDGIVVATATTAADGSYEFDDVPTGSYTIVVDESTLPVGLDRPTFDPDGALDGRHPVVVPPAGSTGNDFGYTGSGEVAGDAFVDDDGDGVVDTGEPVAAGVKMTITWPGPDGVLGTDDDVVFVVTSGDDGSFDLPNLPGGTYRLEIDPATVPAAFDLIGATSTTFTLDGGETLTLDVLRLRRIPTPATGSSPALLLQLAVATLGAGVLLLGAARRRRRTA